MNNPKSDLPGSDHDDHAQPINLAAPRAPGPINFTTNPGPTTSTQPVTLRTHAEVQKPGVMALYIRTPTTRPPGPSHVMSPVMGSQAAGTPHFNTKPMFKSVKGVKVNYYSEKSDKSGVIRVPPTDSSQLQGNITTQSGSLVSSILPTTLGGSSARHMVPTAVHPVISGSTSNAPPMASIIKGAHQVGHVIHPPYSSHVPRGPAAVASITSAPKSAVATPILRTPHSSSAMTLASSVIAPHATSFRTRSPTLVAGRTATPPVGSTISHQQVMDLQKSAVGHSLQTQSTLASRSMDMSNSSIRQGISHTSASHNKPMNISQPIVQHLQQVRKHVPDKSYLKPISSSGLSSSTQSNSTPAHQNSSHPSGSHSTNSDIHGVAPTIARATLPNMSGSSGYAAGIVQLSSSSVPALRPSLVQPHQVHALSSSSVSSSPHQTLTVISAKPLQSTSSPVTLSSQSNRTATVCGASGASSGPVITTASNLLSGHSRLMTAPNSVNQSTAIPVAKVYPQSLPVQVKVDSINLDSNRTGTPGSTTSSVMSPTVSTATTQAVGVAEKRSDSAGPVRVTSLGKHTVPNAAYTSVPPATYLYDQYHGTTLAVHPYSMPSSNQNFSGTSLSGSQLRPLALSQHGNANMGSGMHPAVCASGSSSGSVAPLNSLMVAVDSRHIALHSPYNATSSGNKQNSEASSHQSSTAMSNAAAAGLVVMSQASSTPSSGGSSQGGGSSNHLSPRPSILRKRTTEGVPAVTKRNLIPSLCATESLNQRPEFKPSITALQSLKSAGESLQENGISKSTSDADNGRLLITAPIIKKEPGITDKNSIKESPVETSPRKKPRKQLLRSTNELIETHSSDAEENFSNEAHTKEEKIEESENVKSPIFTRPTMSLLKNYKHSWKSRNNHFLRYSDIKYKEEKKPSVHELANQKGVLHDVNAWKIYHLTGQMENLKKAEDTSIATMSRWLALEGKGSWVLNNALGSDDYAKIITKLTDIVKGNLQRSKIAQEQALESKQQILKVVEHKPHLLEIINKYISRRPLKKKEKT